MSVRFLLLWCFVVVFLSAAAQSQKTIQVKSMSELQKAIQQAIPGTTILLHDGTYLGEHLNISKMGTRGKPIIIKSLNAGKATIHTPVAVKGDFISLIGLNFEEKGNLSIEGQGNRISRCTMTDVKTPKWIRVLPGSSKIEIDYNTFQNKTSNINYERGCQLMQIIVRNRDEQHHIHHNLFRNIPQGSGNGFETLQLITENNPFDPAAGDCNSLIEHNLFVRCNGESEIISVKSNGNLLRKNVFRACRGALVLRHGDDNIVTGNSFFGDGEAGSGGVRIQGTGQIVANNYFYGLQRFGLGMMDGTPDDLYIRVENAQILLNTFVNCTNTFQIGLNHSKHPNGTVPRDCIIAGNIFYKDPKHNFENGGPFVTFVQNDQPENWKWYDNITYGNKAQNTFKGLLVVDPKLEFRDSGFAVPTTDTPKSSDPLKLIGGTEVDLLGSVRSENTTIGAIHYLPEVSVTILNEKTVGPNAFKE